MSTEPGDGWRTLCEVPEGAVVAGGAEIVHWIDEQGNSAWGFRCPEGAEFSTILGFLELAKHRVLQEWDLMNERRGGP